MFRCFEKRIDPYPDTKVPQPKNSFLAFIWHSTNGMRSFIALMALFSALVGGVEAVLFSVVGQVVDWLNQFSPQTFWQKAEYQLWMLAAFLMASIGVVALQTLYTHQTLAVNFPMRLRWHFHRYILGQSIAFFQNEFSGRIAAKVMQTALAVRDTVFILCDMLTYVVVYFITMLVVLIHFDGRLVLPFLIWLVLYIGAACYFVPRLGKIAVAQADARSLMIGRISDSYSNISTVKLFGHTWREFAYVKEAMNEFLAPAYMQMRLVSQFEIANQLLNVLLIAGTSLMALYAWSFQWISVGAVAASLTMAMRLNGFSHWIMWQMSLLFEQVGTVQDGIGTLSRPIALLDKHDAPSLTVKEGGIVFERVSFSYDSGRDIIDDLTLRVKPGEKIGLVGRSGAGKSTLINLLLRFYDIQHGRILIDGQDIREVSQESLRAALSMVTQDTSLLNRSLRENLMYGQPQATEEEMINAAKEAQAEAFIAELEDTQGRRGYDAHVGERGIKLSGGQRQRIAIARVILKDAPILLLDEATSALDSEVELAIQRSLNRLMERKTVIAIAHRLSTIAAMDRLIIIDHGQIIEEGTHAELLVRDGIYARLWTHQSGGFIGKEL